MKDGLNILLVILVLLPLQFVALVSNATETNDKFSIEPDPKIQNWIKSIVTLETREQIRQEISELKKKSVSDEHLIQQLIYFQVHTMRMFKMKMIKITGNEFEKIMWSAYGTIGVLLDLDKNPKITPESSCTLINAVLPYLRTKDPDLRERLHEVLDWIDQRKGPWKDYSGYEPYLESKKDEPPEALIEYMYRMSPSEAVTSMARIYANAAAIDEIRTGLQKEEPQILDSFSKRDEWWAHLYVAEKMRKNPKLQSSTIIARLKKSKHPLVQEAIKEIEACSADEKK